MEKKENKELIHKIELEDIKEKKKFGRVVVLEQIHMLLEQIHMLISVRYVFHH